MTFEEEDLIPNVVTLRSVTEGVRCLRRQPMGTVGRLSSLQQQVLPDAPTVQEGARVPGQAESRFATLLPIVQQQQVAH